MFTSCPTALAAEREFSFVGGMTISNMGGDATLLGEALASGLESTVGGTWTSQKRTRTGLDVGVGLGLSSSGPVGAALEMHYVTRGVNWNLDELSGSGIRVKTGLKASYLEFPLLLQASPRASGSVRPLFMIGPVVGIKTSATFSAKGPGGSSSTDAGDGVKAANLACLIGAGVKIRASSRSSVVLQTRFQTGLTNALDDPVLTAKPQDFALLAGYSFRL
jgi:hypothetical protein